ncbi:MAG: zinc ribbon domain-containing protein [Chloroflexota bacterium]|nr:zinc ribbon domain-containing protein [Chloroflexota bacterium]
MGPTPLECPGCGSASFTAGHDGRLICNYCHVVYVPPEQVCPVCGAAYEPDAHRCPSCGAEMVRECPNCGAPNSLLARQCRACGQRLEILDTLFDRVTGTRADWLHQVREEAPTIKAQEEAASQARLAEMWVTEEHRRETLAQAQGEQKRQERFIITVAIALVVIVIFAGLVALAIMTRGPAP